MPLNGNVLGTTIKATIDGLNPDSGLLSGGENATLLATWQAISTDIVNHFIASGVIVPGTFNVGGAPVIGTGLIT